MIEASERAFLTVTEAAYVLHVSEVTVRRMIARGELRARRCGRLIRIPARSLDLPTDIVPLRVNG
jgi:excisionase family DNA binding protein